jgi:hypothetical protein
MASDLALRSAVSLATLVQPLPEIRIPSAEMMGKGRMFFLPEGPMSLYRPNDQHDIDRPGRRKP